MITDKRRSSSAAKKELRPDVAPRSHQGLTKRAETSPLAVRRRERAMMRFIAARQCRRFVSSHDPVANLFYLAATT